MASISSLPDWWLLAIGCNSAPPHQALWPTHKSRFNSSRGLNAPALLQSNPGSSHCFNSLVRRLARQQPASHQGKCRVSPHLAQFQLRFNTDFSWVKFSAGICSTQNLSSGFLLLHHLGLPGGKSCAWLFLQCWFFADLGAPPLLPAVGFKNKRKFHYCSSAASRERDGLWI